MPLRRPSLSWPTLLAGLFAAVTAAAGVEIGSVTRVTQRAVQHERVDFTVVLTAPWTDPHDSAQVRLDLEFMGPDGRPHLLPAFHESGTGGTPSVWRARWAPRDAGENRVRFRLTTPVGATESAPLTVPVEPGRGRGFLHAAGPWVLRFDNGEPFRGLGENLGWESRSPDDSRHFRALHEHPRFHYEYLVGRLAANGGNFFRTWMCAWNLPLEWNRVMDTRRYADETGRFHSGAAARLDELVAVAAASGTYFMLTLDPHVSYMGRGWELNPYNRANGGPAATPEEFFTSEAARARYRDRLRYLVARWGYSPHLGVWEFFNEIDHVVHLDPAAPMPAEVITRWHAEMAAHLRALDPYGRPVTTSVSHRDIAGLNQLPGLDFNQRHLYRDTAALPATLRQRWADEGKPYVIGEYGYEWDWTKNFDEFAGAMDADFRRGLWLGLFSPTPILPLSWWWEYFDERGTTAGFAGVRTIHERMLAAGGGDFAEVTAEADGSPVLAVRCGRTVFVLLENPGTTERRLTVRLPARAADFVPAELFDPATGEWTRLPDAQAQPGPVVFSNLALPAGAIRVLQLGHSRG
ncbi:glycoside hydrolase [Oleiharenicola lentus]|uniref:Glycoside hydrolase n=1 Tax=Oleiharenicola lentus TaxID=2508720 RepID=A0A4Q1C4Q6_9BACT|nr:glycoside hydrolase [Oleiharenicola lentus]RXK53370.1 glycoside hydrolase [Oleiharenicola lentus]